MADRSRKSVHTLFDQIEQQTADGHWLAGLVDGEGCFALWTRTRRVGRSDNCQAISFVFKIAMRADDLDVLKKAQAILGVGGIGFNRRGTRGAKAYIYNGRTCLGKPLAQLVARNKAEIAKVIAFFRQYQLRSKKRRDFDLWAKAFDVFVQHTTTAPRKWQARTNTPQIRPPQGAPLKRYKRIPAELYAEIQKYEKAIKAVRQYQEVEGVA